MWHQWSEASSGLIVRKGVIKSTTTANRSDKSHFCIIARNRDSPAISTKSLKSQPDRRTLLKTFHHLQQHQIQEKPNSVEQSVFSLFEVSHSTWRPSPSLLCSRLLLTCERTKRVAAGDCARRKKERDTAIRRRLYYTQVDSVYMGNSVLRTSTWLAKGQQMIEKVSEVGVSGRLGVIT